MSFGDELRDKVDEIVRYNWSSRDGRVVPDTGGLAFKSEGVYFDRATILYADLRGSTDMVHRKKWWYSAEVYKAFLYCAGRIIRRKQGVITSYDGDRIMAIFVGGSQTSNAARAALKLNHAVSKIINPRFVATYGDNHIKIRHTVGIDTSKIWAVKTGVRADHDVVWIGRAANIAAKLSEVNSDKPSWVTQAAYRKMSDEVKISKDNRAMWTRATWSDHNDAVVYGSSWRWGAA